MGLRDWLDWEENVFRGLLGVVRRVRPASHRLAEAQPGRVELEGQAASLSVLAQLIAGRPVRLRPSSGVGGLRGDDLLLPAAMTLGDDPAVARDAYRVQAAILAGLHRIARDRPAVAGRDYEGELASLELTARAVRLIGHELPGFAPLHASVMQRVLAERAAHAPPRLPARELALERARRSAVLGGRPWDDPQLRRELVGPRPAARRRSPPLAIWGEMFETPAEVASGAASEDLGAIDERATELEAPEVTHLRRVDLQREGGEEPPPIAPFERTETLDQHRGGRRDLDGSDELEAHLDALEQVDLGDLFRGNESAESLLKADLDFGFDVGDAQGAGRDEPGIPYDEWDARKRAYRKAWCRVHPAPAPRGDADWAKAVLRTHRDVVRRLRHQLEAQRAGLRAAPRQLDGEDIDLESAIDDQVAHRMGRGGDPRLYVRQRKRRRDFATTVLVDVSMSTDAWVAGRRVLDVAREATLVLGEVAQQLGDRVDVLAFASQTRHQCRVWRVFGEGDAWNDGRLRLAGLTPQGYTRIGPALRHATATLAAVPAERRLLLLVSDGKPTDYDRYEGRYGVADVRQAIREAHRAEIHTHALAVDAVARDYLPALFGEGGWHILPRPDDLVPALTTVYGRLTAR